MNGLDIVVRELFDKNNAVFNWDAIGPIANCILVLFLIITNIYYIKKLNDQIKLANRDADYTEWIRLVNPLYHNVVNNPKLLSMEQDTEQHNTELERRNYEDAFLMPAPLLSQNYPFLQCYSSKHNKDKGGTDNIELVKERQEDFWGMIRENCVLGPPDLRKKILNFLKYGTPKNPPGPNDPLYQAIDHRYEDLQHKFDRYRRDK